MLPWIAAGDRAHDAREVDLNPHHGVGLAVADGSNSIPQRAVEVPIGPANAIWRGASTAVTSWLRPRENHSGPLARWSSRAPG